MPAPQKKQLKTLVIGATGHGGSYLCVELVNRGHKVTGLARNPGKLGPHEFYTPRKFDIVECSFAELMEELKGFDVVFNEFSPHSQGHAALVYMPFVEVTRKIVRAARLSKIPYFIMVGGAGSLELPQIEPYLNAGESGHFWRAFRQAFADSESQIQYMEERLGPLGEDLRKLRTIRQRAMAGIASEDENKFMREYLDKAFKGDYSQTFVKAGRTTYMFFEGNTSWNWSYVSPPALYRPCAGGEDYTVSYDNLPLTAEPQVGHYQGWWKHDPKDLEGRLKGISTIDFSRALVDDAESRNGLHKHWTATTDLKDDTPFPSYVNFELGYAPRSVYESQSRKE
ncbi:hypothetical protein DL98DRAFT_423605 [Cadophora sp. DSE1049]|nr:hypothetical protein DL98DRAFT_423605 [Cadophora sp. DSE1049]